jgi:SMC interacting uncharacterized protein involved in chromosome segregation
MPRKRNKRPTGLTSAFRQVQRQAQSLMANLQKEIRSKESDLRRLKEEQSRLSMLIGRQASSSKSASSADRPARSGGRVNWRVVLQQLPKQFKAADIRAVPGLKGKRPSEIFAAITRWIEAGAARRKSRGMYLKI